MVEQNQEHSLFQVIFECKRSMVSLFVRWQMSNERMRMIASYLEADSCAIKQGVRLYDATDDSCHHSIRDFVMNETADSCSIQEVEAGRIYIVDYGFFHQGRFYPILRSEPVAFAI